MQGDDAPWWPICAIVKIEKYNKIVKTKRETVRITLSVLPYRFLLRGRSGNILIGAISKYAWFIYIH